MWPGRLWVQVPSVTPFSLNVCTYLCAHIFSLRSPIGRGVRLRSGRLTVRVCPSARCSHSINKTEQHLVTLSNTRQHQATPGNTIKTTGLRSSIRIERHSHQVNIVRSNRTGATSTFAATSTTAIAPAVATNCGDQIEP